MYTIRPYQLFTLAESSNIVLPIPVRRASEGGCPSLLETFLLLTAAKIVDARSIFEFGTCRGTTALNLAMNTKAQIHTLDLACPITGQHPSDQRYTSLHLSNRMDFEGTEYRERIVVLQGDSRKFNYFPFLNKMDMVFVDGGHDYQTVKNDTEAAFELVQGKDAACIAWHDYREPLHSGIAYLLDSMADCGTDLFRVEDTVLCFWFSGAISRRLSA